MPRITLRTHGGYESITRPIALSIARDVMAATGIKEEDTRLLIYGEFGFSEQPGAKIGEDGEVGYGTSSRMDVTMEDTPRYQSILSTHVRTPEHPPILEDTRLGIAVYPIYVDSEITLTFTFKGKNKEEVKKWQDDFMIRRAEDRTVLSHELQYYIPIQDGVWELLSHLHALREKTSGYGDTFDEYIRSIQCHPLTTRSRVDGDMSTSMVSIPKKDIQVTGWFDFLEPPKAERDEGGTRWSAEWSYKALYKRCTHFHIVYPLVVHQTHISSKYFERTKVFAYEDMPRTPGLVVRAHEIIKERSAPTPTMMRGGLRYPEWDDWIPDPNCRVEFGIPQITWLVGLDGNEPRKLFDLKTMPELRLTLELEAYLRKYHDRVTVRRKAAVIIHVYKDNRIMDEDSVYLDKDLVLWSKNGLDLRHMYHVRLSLVKQRNYLNVDAVKSLVETPESAWGILKTIDPSMDDDVFQESMISEKYINPEYIDEFYRAVEENPSRRTVGSHLRTVQSLYILTQREST